VELRGSDDGPKCFFKIGGMVFANSASTANKGEWFARYRDEESANGQIMAEYHDIIGNEDKGPATKTTCVRAGCRHRKAL